MVSAFKNHTNWSKSSAISQNPLLERLRNNPLNPLDFSSQNLLNVLDGALQTQFQNGANGLLQQLQNGEILSNLMLQSQSQVSVDHLMHFVRCKIVLESDAMRLCMDHIAYTLYIKFYLILYPNRL